MRDQPLPLALWWAAARPRTLVLSLAPVLLGTATGASAAHGLAWGPALAALLCAGLIQTGTNLHNDVADFIRGVDTEERLGPPRATVQGWFSPAAVRRASRAAFLVAFLAGCYLAWFGGWPIVLIGLLSLAAGAAYSGGPRPISHGPLGELFVLLFFGVIAVGGSDYLQTLQLRPQALLAGLVPGLPAAAVLLLNNYRDLEGDRQAGRRTLCHYLQRERCRPLFALLLLLPLVAAFACSGDTTHGMIPLLALPMAVRLTILLWHAPIGPELNRLLAGTAAYTLILSLLTGLAVLLA